MEDEKNQKDDKGNENGEEESAISPAEAVEAVADVMLLNADCQSSSMLSASYEADHKITVGDSKGIGIYKASVKVSKETAERRRRVEIRRKRRDRKVSEKGGLIDSKRRTAESSTAEKGGLIDSKRRTGGFSTAEKGGLIDSNRRTGGFSTAEKGGLIDSKRRTGGFSTAEKGGLVDSKRRTVGFAKRVALTPAKLAYSATNRYTEKEKAVKSVVHRDRAVKGGMDKSKTTIPSVRGRNNEKKDDKANWRSDRFALGEDVEADPGAVRVEYRGDSATFLDSESRRASESSTQTYQSKRESDNEIDGEVVSAAVVDEEALQKEFESKLKAGMVQAAEVDVYKEPGCFERHSSKIYGLGCIVVLALAIGLGVGLGGSSGPSAIQNVTNITNSPTMSPTFRSDVEFLEDLFIAISGSDAFENASTPQARAFESILNETESGAYGAREVTEQYLKERYALRVLYYSTHGEGWADNNFTSTLETCTWMDGIQGSVLTCNDRGEVTSLLLDVFNLNGTIPSELAAISKLSQLSLGTNMLYGTIPNSLGELSDMKFLQLAVNALSGTIPNSFKKHTKMEKLLLQVNKLTGTMPNIWGNSLSRLRLDDNKMNGTIPAIPSQMLLDWFQINNNDFSGTLPLSLAAQPRLKTLIVSNNRFEGSIPTQFGALSSMEAFAIDGNRFNSSLPSSLGRYEEINYIRVNDNAFTGTLPASFGQLTTVFELRFENNNFEGTLPSAWSSLKKLEELNVSNNRDLRGTIPASYSSMEKLTSVALEGTQISGGLTETFCAMEQAISVSAECGGATPTIDCPCCHVCCDGGNCMLRDLNSTCLWRAETLENIDKSRDNACACSEDSKQVECTETCESCGLDDVSCVRSNRYGSELDPVTGELLDFYNDFAYMQGPYNGTVLSFREVVIDDVTDRCEVMVNGETCRECRRQQCRSDLVGLAIVCDNLDVPAEINTCDDQATPNYLEAFTFSDSARASGCPLFLYRVLDNYNS
eukprot:scaffold4586_cov133-Cylindrotheca_fusiformis.AAC.3